MPFDAKDYRNRVLNEYRKGKGPALRDALRELREDPSLSVPGGRFDLADFYDVSPGTSDAELAQQISAVDNAIKVAVQKPGWTRQPLDFHEIVLSRNPEIRTMAFWDKILAAKSRQAAEALAEFGEQVAAEYQGLKIVTPDSLRRLAKSAGVADSVSDGDLARVVGSAGISVVDDIRPISAPPAIVKEISTALQSTSCRSVLSAIFIEQGEPASFSILDGLRTDDPRLVLSLAAVDRAVAHAHKLSDTNDNNTIGKILGALRRSAASDAELLDIVIAIFLETGRRIDQEGGPKRRSLKTFVERTGITEPDAARILLHVAPQSGGQPRRGWNDVQALIADGALKEARRLYESLWAEKGESTSDDQKAALNALEGTERRVVDLTAEARTAVARGDLETAARALNQALTLCSDDESLARTARDLPPSTPLKAVAAVSADARTVRLSWEPGFGTTEDVVYQVIRTTGRAPRNNLDGEKLGAPVSGTTFEDSAPPVAVPVFYGVSATRGSGSSPVAVTEILALPPVTEVVVTSDPSSVTLRWTTPPESRTIEVTQSAPDGTTTQLQPSAHSGATAGGLRTGATYTYFLTAIYAGAAGQTLRSETVRVTGVPRGEAQVVAQLTVGADPDGTAGSSAQAVWKALDGYPVEIWHYEQKPEWRRGERLPMTEVRRRGTQLAGRPVTGRPGHDGVRGAAGEGLRHYVAVTRDGDDGRIGAFSIYGAAPTIRNLRVERFGDEVVLSWDWPGPEYEVRARWSSDGTTGERTISHSEYRVEGGCRIVLGSAGGTVSVATVAGDGDDRWLSPETTATVSGAATAVPYTIEFRRRLLGGAGSATLHFEPPAGAPAFDVVIVGSAGKTMPFDAKRGSVLTRTTVSSASPSVSVDLPRVKGTFWLRAFSTSPGSRLIDPPPVRMKVE